MKKGWQTKKLSDLYQIGSSKRVLKSQWKTEGVPFYRGREVTRLAADGFVDNELFISEKHFAELSKEYGVPKAGDIVITAIGTIGNSHVVRSSDLFYFKDASVLWMKRTSEVSSEFVNLWLKSPSFFDQLDRGNGATVDTLTIQKLQSVELFVPPLAEQRRIVGLLDEAFEGIATAKANAEKNLQNARALFASHHNSIFSHRREGWAEKPLGEVCEYVNGKAHERCIDEGGRFIVINSKFISTEGEVFKRSNDALLLLQPGEIAMVLSDVPNGKALAKCFLVKESNTYTLNQRICLIRSTKFHTKFLFYQLNRNRHFLSFDNGENQTNMRLNQVLSCPLFLPPLAEQETIADTLDSLSEETQRLAAIYQQKLAALDALKKSLLHRAFAGEL